MFKVAGLSFLGLAIIIGLGWGLGYNELLWMKFFNPRKENIRREVFENTKSYTHGKIQDLAKYYDEYQASDDKESIETIIKMRFAEFPADRIQNYNLKQFLISTRGY